MICFALHIVYLFGKLHSHVIHLEKKVSNNNNIFNTVKDDRPFKIVFHMNNCFNIVMVGQKWSDESQVMFRAQDAIPMQSSCLK